MRAMIIIERQLCLIEIDMMIPTIDARLLANGMDAGVTCAVVQQNLHRHASLSVMQQRASAVTESFLSMPLNP